MEKEFDWANWISYERWERQWSVSEMARKARVPGVPYEYLRTGIERIEKGKVALTFRMLILITRAFGLSPHEAFTLAGAKFHAPANPAGVTRRGVGEFVRARRKALKMTLHQLERRCGYHSANAIYSLERLFPVRIRVDFVIQLDRALECDGRLVGLVWAMNERELAESPEYE